METSRGEGPVDRAVLEKLASRFREAGTALALLNFDLANPGEWEPLLGMAEVITASSREALYALLDRGFRSVELPAAGPDQSGPGADKTADQFHLALVETMIRRRLEPQPSVSVAVPVYNTPPEYLREMIQSVLDQDDPDWELVLLDTGDPAASGPVGPAS
jgi:hypothetical protein